ncbi:MAG: class I SAM-dependent methyltransferase [Candidatus Woesearchaeota archaeon]
MLEQITYQNNQELQDAQLTTIVNVASEIYQSNGNKPIRILDLATGPNGFNPVIVRNLIDRGIDYELVLSDISPTHFRIGYENLEQELSPEELQKVKCVLADSRDFKRNLTEVPLWGEGRKPLEEVLEDPRYQFLQTGYQDGQRTVDFTDGAFDLVIGNIPYGSINTGDYSDAIDESARVLKPSGYHIVDEMHVENVQSYGLRAWCTLKEMFGKPLREAYPTARRSLSAISRARAKDLQEVSSKLDSVLTPVAVYSTTYVYDTEERIPEQTLQKGDLVKRAVFVHQKVD